MCESKYIKYTCGCKKEMEFIQCTMRQGGNVKCDPVTKAWGKDSANYCSEHLVKQPKAPVKYHDRNGEIVEE